jgi:hypothetical protein
MSLATRPPVRVTAELVPPPDLEALRRFARLLDEQFLIPGTERRFGVDALVGLVPGIGDLIGAALSTWIVIAAIRHRVPTTTIVRMLWNIAADEIVGTIPVIGDVFDVLFKENVLNVEMVLRDRDPSRPPRAWSEIAFAGTVLGIVILAMSVGTLVVLGFAIGRFLWHSG